MHPLEPVGCLYAEDHGLFGLLARHCEVPDDVWESHGDFVQQLELKARQAKSRHASSKLTQKAMAR